MQRFSHFPDAPEAGKTYKLFFDFADLQATSVQVTATYTNGDTDVYTINRSGDGTGWVEVSARAGQIGCVWTDSLGASNAYGVAFQ